MLGGIVWPGRRGPQQGATRSNVEPLEQRVLFASTPAWLAPGSAATWDPNSHALAVTGPATIVADPGADEPRVTVSGSGATLTIQPATDTWIHLGSLTLTNGGRAEVTRPNATSFDENASLVLELGLAGNNAAAPLSIDSGTGSTLGIEDNDLIVRGGTDAVPAYIWNVAVQASDLASSLGTLNPADFHQDGLATPDDAAAAQWDVAGRSLTLNPGDALVKYFPAGEVPAWPTPGAPPAGGATPTPMREQVGPRYVASAMFAQTDLASGPLPAYVVSAVVNGNNAGLLGPQRSMVDDVEYTFSEPVTLDPSTAFGIALQPGQSGTLPTLSLAAINPDASGAATQWDVTFAGASVIAGSIANGVYVLTLNPAAVTSEANPSIPAQPHNPDIFSRLFGDGDANGVVNDADNALFVAAQTTYNPAFDYNGDGFVNNADNFQLRKDEVLTYTGTISFNPAALRPADVSAAVTGPNAIALSWTGPADPNVSGYSVQRWAASSGTWTTVATGLPGDSTSFTDTAAPAGDTCEYEVAAEETGLTSDWSLPSNDVATPMVAPANLVVVRTDAGVVLRWDAVPGATQYTLYRQGPGDDGFVALTPTTTATTYTDSSAGPDATCAYYVTATFPVGESAPSAPVGA